MILAKGVTLSLSLSLLAFQEQPYLESTEKMLTSWATMRTNDIRESWAQTICKQKLDKDKHDSRDCAVTPTASLYYIDASLSCAGHVTVPWNQAGSLWEEGTLDCPESKPFFILLFFFFFNW